MIPADLAEEAMLGSYCPKMCNFACPVLNATGREGASPWALHTTVTGLATRARAPDEATYHALRGCTGCQACREACLFDLDVAAEVRAARRAIVAAGVAPRPVAEARAAVEHGGSPYGVPSPARPDGDDDAEVAVVISCADQDRPVRAAADLLAAAGVQARFVAPDGCCGAVLADLGDTDTAQRCVEALRERIRDVERVAALDPHCLPQIRRATAAPVRSLVVELAELLGCGRLELDGEVGPVVYHEACVLVREESVVAEPMDLLAAVGASVADAPAGGCSGAGMAFDLVDPVAADSVAERCATTLQKTDGTVVTTCARAARRLRGSGLFAADLFELLAANATRGRS